MGQAAEFTPSELSQLAADIYRGESNALVRNMQRFRPYICPLDDVLRQVPAGARVMDVGCGAGLLLLLLASRRKISAGFGFDVSKYPIAAAVAAAERLKFPGELIFSRRSIEDGIPHENWAVVTSVDVLHHIPPPFQRKYVGDLSAAVPVGGRLIIKDMVAKPRWRAMANRLHDLVMARQIVHHVDPSAVEQWAVESGLQVAYRSQINIWWYGHWTLVLDRPR